MTSGRSSFNPIAAPALNTILLLILPAVMVVLGLRQLHAVQPFYQFDYDPNYVYLLNGLLLIQGHSPGHYDHPGTPVQMLAGLVILFRWLVTRLTDPNDGGIVRSVLAEPEIYLATISKTFLALAALANVYLGHRIQRASGRICYGLMAQLGPLLLGEQMINLFNLSAEPGLFIVAILLMAVLADSMFRGQRATARTALAAGALCGVGIAVKVTFLPMLAMLLLLADRRNLVLAAVAAVATFLICVSPVIPVLQESLQFYARIATHTGGYGSGDPGVFDWSKLPARFGAIASAEPAFLISIGGTILAVISLLRKRRQPAAAGSSWLMVVATALLLAQAGSLVIVLKHFGVKYLLPGLSITSTTLAWLTWLVARSLHPRRAAALQWIAAVALASLGTWQVWHLQNELDAKHAQNALQLSRIAEIMKQYPNAVLISDYRAPSLGHAINFGLGYTRGYFVSEAASLRPDRLMLGGRVLVKGGGDTIPASGVDAFIAAGRPVLAIALATSNLSAFRTSLLADLGTVKIFRVESANP